MKFFSRLFAARGNTNLTTVLERQRLSNTMPGQTGAMAASRPASPSSELTSPSCLSSPAELTAVLASKALA